MVTDVSIDERVSPKNDHSKVDQIIDLIKKRNGHSPNDLEGLKQEIKTVIVSRDRKTPLTLKQKKVLEFIEDYIKAHGIAPLIDEIKEGINVSSKSTVYEHLQELENRGYIIREPNKARAITIIQSSKIEKDSASQNSFSSNRALECAKQAVQEASDFTQAIRSMLLAQILGKTRARSISLYLVSEQDEKSFLAPVAWQGCWRIGEKPREFEFGLGVAGNVWKTGKMFVSKGNVQDHEWYQVSTDERAKSIHSMLVIPIHNFSGNFIGVLNLDSNLTDKFKGFGALEKKLDCIMKDLGSCEFLMEHSSVEVFLWILQNSIP